MTLPIPQISNNVLKPSGFALSIAKFPDVSFQVQSVTVPTVTLGTAWQQTSEQDIAHPGDKLTYPPFSVNLLLDENMVSYTELHGWMRDLSAFKVPQDDLAQMLQRFSAQPTGGAEDTSDVILTVLNSKNNPVVNFRLIDAFPVAVGGFVFDTTDNGETILKFGVEFAYTYFVIEDARKQ